MLLALAEITTIMGSEAVVQAAEQYGKNFICSEKIEAVDLQDLCYKVDIKFIVPYSFFVGTLRNDRTFTCYQKSELDILFSYQYDLKQTPMDEQ